jgi:hypothetical protein
MTKVLSTGPDDHYNDAMSAKDEILALTADMNREICRGCVLTGLRAATLTFAAGMLIEDRRVFVRVMKKDLAQLLKLPQGAGGLPN